MQIGWFGGGLLIDDGGALDVGVAVGGEGVSLLVWVWVCYHGCGFRLAVAGCGDRGLLFFWVLMVDYGLLVVVVLGVCSAVVVGLW